MNKKILVTSVLLALGSSAWADTADEEIALLKEQLKVLSAKIEQLEQKTNKTQAEVEAVAKADNEADAEAKTEKSWADRIQFSGDIRDRFEYIDQRGRDVRTRQIECQRRSD